MTLKFLKKLKEFMGQAMPDPVSDTFMAVIDEDPLFGEGVTDSGTKHDMSVRYPTAPQIPNYQISDFISRPMCSALAPMLKMDPIKLMAFCATQFFYGGNKRLEEELSRLIIAQNISREMGQDMQGQDGHIQDHIVGHEERTIYNQ